MARKTLKFELNPLFSGPTLESRNRSGSPFRELSLSDIDVDPDQPRRVFESEALGELAESIKLYGVLCPVLVRVGPGGTYRLIAGERRLRAAKLAGLEKIPAVIDPAADSADGDVNGQAAGDILSKQLIENLQRQDLTPMERALAVGQLRDRYQWSVRDIASHLGVSKSLVQRSMEILELPDDLKSALMNGIPESKVLLLAGISDQALRKQLLDNIGELTREELDQRLQEFLEKNAGGKLSHGGTAEAGRSGGKGDKRRKLSVEDRRILEEIQRTLGTKVELSRKNGKKDGSGRITIDFYSPSDLYEIYRRLTA